MLATVALIASDLFVFRTNLVSNSFMQAQIIGSDAVSRLIFNDAKSAENTLSALHASQPITYARIYSASGNILPGDWSDHPSQRLLLPSFNAINRELVNFGSEEFSPANPRRLSYWRMPENVVISLTFWPSLPSQSTQ